MEESFQTSVPQTVSAPCHRSDRQEALACIAGAVRAGRLQPESLKAPVCSVVAEMKRQQAAPDEVIETIKQLVGRGPTSSWASGDDQFARIVDRVVAWCIGEYYRES